MSAEQIARDAKEAWDSMIDCLDADGYEVVPKGMQAERDALAAAVEQLTEALNASLTREWNLTEYGYRVDGATLAEQMEQIKDAERAADPDNRST